MPARRLRTVFFGSSEFAVPLLLRMVEQQDVVAVCSQPEKPAGRGLALTPTPVAAAARKAGREVLTPQRLDSEFVQRVALLHADLLACSAYGKILPAALLELPNMTALNVHPSLLPHYRGATPIQSALRDGRQQTGVTVFWMTKRMDAGDIALSRAEPIKPSDDYGTLHDRLALIGADLLGQAAILLAQGKLTRERQREEDATYCKPLTKEDLRLQLDVPAPRVIDQIRSLSPKPGAWMLFDGKRLKVLEAEVVADVERSSLPEDEPDAERSSLLDRAQRRPGAKFRPGTVIAIDSSGPVIATQPGAIRLLRVIPEGRPQMSGAEFAKASSSRR